MARYGLKRVSFCTYEAVGNNRRIVIRRNGPRHWLLGDAGNPLIPGIFCLRFSILREAAEFAWRLVRS